MTSMQQQYLIILLPAILQRAQYDKLLVYNTACNRKSDGM
jgi:hypothetical protein